MLCLMFLRRGRMVWIVCILFFVSNYLILRLWSGLIECLDGFFFFHLMKKNKWNFCENVVESQSEVNAVSQVHQQVSTLSTLTSMWFSQFTQQILDLNLKKLETSASSWLCNEYTDQGSDFPTSQQFAAIERKVSGALNWSQVWEISEITALS